VPQPGHDRCQIEGSIERLERSLDDVSEHGFPFRVVEEADVFGLGHRG
jgi:hypothetical protein